MAKYDFEFKKKVVEAYLRGEGGYQTLSKKYGLKSTRQIGYWVKAYKKWLIDKFCWWIKFNTKLSL